MKKFAIAIPLFISVLCCSPGARRIENTRSDTVVAGLEGSPITLDPRLARDAYSTRIIPLLFHGLVKLNERAETVPDAAQDWEVLNEKIFVFHLKPGIRFSNGRELDAFDVEYTIKSLSDPDLKSPYQDVASRIKEMRVIDARTIRIEIIETHAPFLSQLSLGIVPRDMAESSGKSFGRAPVGSGPYMVKSFEAGGEVELEANPYYKGERGGISRIVFRVIPDDVTRIMALQRGEVHILQNSVPPDDLPALIKDACIEVSMKRGINYTYLGFNLDDPVLKEIKVRQAIAHAIPRDDLVNCLLQGQAEKATGLLAPSHWAYEPDVKTYEYNPGRAMELLNEAGYEDPDGGGPKPRFSLVYKTSQNKMRRWMAETIAYELGKVGIEVEVRSYEFGTLFADILAGRFQIYSLTWVGVTEPDIYYTVFNSKSVPPHGANRGRYSDPEVDRLTEQARVLAGQTARKHVYSMVQKILARDLPYVSLWYSTDVVARDARLKNFRIFPGGDWRSLALAEWSAE